MENLEIKVETGLKRIKCNDYGDVIMINTNDAAVFERFMGVYDNVVSISEEFQKQAEECKKKYTDLTSKEAIIDISRINVSYLNKINEQMDIVFGKGSVKKVFRECYEQNEDYIPDEDSLIDFMEKITPVMEKLFNEKANRNRKRYSVAYKGKTK